MQITVSVGQLRQVLARAVGVTGTKTGSMPILSTVLIEAEQTPEGGMLTAQAYDLEIGVASKVPCEVVKPGAAAVPAKLLADVVKVLPESSVRLALEAQRKLVVTSGAASFRLATLDPADFPKTPNEAGGSNWAPVDAAALVAALDRTAYAMSNDETRYNLNGVYFGIRDGALVLVGTDGHRLAKAEVPGSPAYGLSDAGAIVSGKAVGELRQLLTESSAAPGDLAFTTNAVMYRRPGLQFTARLIDGSFPDWTQVVPKVEAKASHLKVDRAALRDVLRRVLLMTADLGSAVVLQLSEGRLIVTARNADAGEARDELAVDYQGSNLEVAVNGRYLAEIVSVEGSAERLVAQISDELSPLLWWVEGNDDANHVVMPMRR